MIVPETQTKRFAMQALNPPTEGLIMADAMVVVDLPAPPRASEQSLAPGSRERGTSRPPRAHLPPPRCLDSM